MIHPLEQWFLWFVLYSFIGWMYESILCSVAGKKLVNRGFLNGPVCPVYGTEMCIRDRRGTCSRGTMS